MINQRRGFFSGSQDNNRVAVVVVEVRVDDMVPFKTTGYDI
jgi:hypothetical protein